MVVGKWKDVTKDQKDPSASRKFTEIHGYFVGENSVGGIAKTVDGKWNARGRNCPWGPAQTDIEELGSFDTPNEAKSAVEKWAETLKKDGLV